MAYVTKASLPLGLAEPVGSAQRLDSAQPLNLAQRIWQVVAAIPVGRVCSYGEVAKRAGLPGYARYVGTVLKQLPEGSKLPWFRVINSQGRISFAEGSAEFLAQRQHLLAEGVAVSGNKIAKCHWDF